MPIRLAGLLWGGVLLLAVPAAAAPLKVGFRAEGARRTLVSQRTVTLADAPIDKDGDPAHTCPGQSALGALQAGTGGDWDGSWSNGLGYFVTTIRGERPTGTSYFALWVDHRLSQTGLCQTTLRAGDQVLMLVDDADRPVTPLGIRVPASVRRGRLLTLRVVDYATSGRARPAAGATVYANGKRLGRRTDRSGALRVRATKAGRVSFYATKPGTARSEVVATHIRAR
jgi:hypothetical protein